MKTNYCEKHKFPLGHKVFVKYEGNEYWVDNESPTIVMAVKNKAPFFIVEHTQDCDGTPLYTLSLLEFPKNTYRKDILDKIIFSDNLVSLGIEQEMSIQLALSTIEIKNMFIFDCISEESIFECL